MAQRSHRPVALRPLLVAALLGWLVLAAIPAGAGPICTCGDAVVCPPEPCDDGNTVSGDGCSFPSCLPEVCGDGIENPDPAPGPAEECDDGNTVDDDGCADTCQLDCGDGEIDPTTTPPETCDDGTGEASADCNDDCTRPECGDGNENQAAGETCDDGNTVDGDGCPANCILNAFWLEGQQACVNAVNKNALGVLKAEDKAIAKCIKAVASGKEADYPACLAAIDTTKAEGKTTATFANKCAGENDPDFAFTDAATVNAGAKDRTLDSIATVLGDPATIALKDADEEGAACQAEAAKRHFKLQETWLSEANKAKKAALKDDHPATPTELAVAIDAAVAGSARITKAENGVSSGIAKKCPDAIVDGLFDCGGATTGNALALCVIASAKRGACLALEAADSLALGCPGDD